MTACSLEVWGSRMHDRGPHVTPEQVRAAIVAADPLTRFSYAWGPLARWPDWSVEQVKDQVLKDLARTARRVPLG